MVVTDEMLRELVREAEEAAVNAETEVRAWQERAQAARSERDAYAATLRRRNGVDEVATLGDTVIEFSLRQDPDWRAMTRVNAVLDAVEELSSTGETVSPADVEMFLRSRGRVNDTRDLIGGALAHLHRSHRVHNMGRGKWMPGPAPAGADEETPGVDAATSTPGNVTPQVPGGDADAPQSPSTAVSADHDSASG